MPPRSLLSSQPGGCLRAAARGNREEAAGRNTRAGRTNEPAMPRRLGNCQKDFGGTPSWTTIAPKLKHNGLMLLLFETPSGFAVFTSSEVHFHLPNTLKDIWAEFADADRACFVAMPNEFQTFEDKSNAINADTGVDKRLADMIYKWYLPGTKLAVGKPEYKTIIESKLGMTCTHNPIVMEIMWGIQHLMHKLVPEEKAEVAKDDRFPMSRGLKMFLSRYGFDVKPEMVNEQIVATASAFFDCDAVYEKHFEYLAKASVLFKKVSDINFDGWGTLKLATALKVVCFPEEDNFHKVLSEDELLKLKEDAPKYNDIVSKVHCMRIYEKISFAHQVGREKKKLLEFLVKEAKAASEKGKLQGELEQSPDEHLISALKPPYLNELSLPKGLKRSWDSAFEPNVLNKSTSGLSVG